MCFGFLKRKPSVPTPAPEPTPEPEPIVFVPSSTEEIDARELIAILHPVFGEGKIHLSDRDHYYLCSDDDIALFLAQDETNKYEYVDQKYDCDDFAYRLMGQFSIPDWSALCFGFFWTNTHAMNCFVNEQREVMFIEPQTDMIYPLSALPPKKLGDGFRWVTM